MMRLSVAVGVLAASLLLAGCQKTYNAYGGAFATKEEALAFQQRFTGETIKQVPVLPTPIADSITMISPTREHATAGLVAGNPALDQDTLSYQVESALVNWSQIPRAVEHRQGFRKVAYKQADTPSLSDIEPGGYLLWLEVPNTRQFFVHVAAKGDTQTTRLIYPDISGGNRSAQVMVIMEALEKFVREHPAKRT